jgi:hypothetical protein
MKIESHEGLDHLSFFSRHRGGGRAECLLVRIVSMGMSFDPLQRLVVLSFLVWPANRREVINGFERQFFE